MTLFSALMSANWRALSSLIQLSHMYLVRLRAFDSDCSTLKLTDFLLREHYAQEPHSEEVQQVDVPARTNVQRLLSLDTCLLLPSDYELSHSVRC